jgi:hypothetical protein
VGINSIEPKLIIDEGWGRYGDRIQTTKNILLTATLHIPRGREDMKGVEFMEENGGREGGGKGKGKLLVLLLPHTISCIEYRSIAFTQRLGFEL